jgi:hypothetical protein
MNSDRPADGRRDVAAGGRDVARYAIEAAVWAPSICDTAPWWFGACSSGACADMADMMVSLHADVERRPVAADPGDREVLISCGAALCTLRLAVLRCGRDPQVSVLPDPDRPDLLAEVRLGGPMPVTGEVCELCWQIRRRRSHRGPFLGCRVGAPLLSGLREEARREGAVLQVASEGVRVALGALTGAGEFDRAHGWCRAEPGGRTGVGVVTVLTTEGDGRRDWLAAGQALARVLLRASAAGLSAAVHTQALEASELRQFIGARFFDGAHPQIVVRLGTARSGLDPVGRLPW